MSKPEMFIVHTYCYLCKWFSSTYSNQKWWQTILHLSHICFIFRNCFKMPDYRILSTNPQQKNVLTYFWTWKRTPSWTPRPFENHSGYILIYGLFFFLIKQCILVWVTSVYHHNSTTIWKYEILLADMAHWDCCC